MSGPLLPVTPGNPEKKRRVPPGLLLFIGLVVAIAAFLLVRGGLSTLFGGANDSAINAKVGDCLNAAANAGDSKVVACDDIDARFKILSILESKTEQQGAECSTSTGAENSSFLFEGKKEANTRGKILCLEAVNR